MPSEWLMDDWYPSVLPGNISDAPGRQASVWKAGAVHPLALGENPALMLSHLVHKLYMRGISGRDKNAAELMRGPLLATRAPHACRNFFTGLGFRRRGDKKMFCNKSLDKGDGLAGTCFKSLADSHIF